MNFLIKIGILFIIFGLIVYMPHFFGSHTETKPSMHNEAANDTSYTITWDDTLISIVNDTLRINNGKPIRIGSNSFVQFPDSSIRITAQNASILDSLNQYLYEQNKELHKKLRAVCFEDGAKAYKIAVLKYQYSKMLGIDVATIDSIFTNDADCQP